MEKLLQKLKKELNTLKTLHKNKSELLRLNRLINSGQKIATLEKTLLENLKLRISLEKSNILLNQIVSIAEQHHGECLRCELTSLANAQTVTNALALGVQNNVLRVEGQICKIVDRPKTRDAEWHQLRQASVIRNPNLLIDEFVGG